MVSCKKKNDAKLIEPRKYRLIGVLHNFPIEFIFKIRITISTNPLFIFKIYRTITIMQITIIWTNFRKAKTAVFMFPYG